jgi:hypothetical protein
MKKSLLEWQKKGGGADSARTESGRKGKIGKPGIW